MINNKLYYCLLGIFPTARRRHASPAVAWWASWWRGVPRLLGRRPGSPDLKLGGCRRRRRWKTRAAPLCRLVSGQGSWACGVGRPRGVAAPGWVLARSGGWCGWRRGRWTSARILGVCASICGPACSSCGATLYQSARPGGAELVSAWVVVGGLRCAWWRLVGGRFRLQVVELLREKSLLRSWPELVMVEPADVAGFLESIVEVCSLLLLRPRLRR